MDLHRKGAFHLSVSDLPQPPVDFNGEVDMECFWDALSLERVGRGFVKSQQKNPFAVPPTFHFWAPWIGKNTRHSNHVLNTEFAKVRPQKTAEVQEITVTEDRLRGTVQAEVVRTLCRECGLDSSGSRTDLLLRLSNEMQSRQTYDKVFKRFGQPQVVWL
ncbi:Nucleolysin TIA-1 [Dissostichus eleginoides]|uniref:Nucleolysin TIA-1 n=1 Tax=Dissostichus eleginoides TaxID=100907 RepID=A0AAD9BD51_DISEL|nr:Nucleolysin TIA-1 [Dissostichus eleginoides]